MTNFRQGTAAMREVTANTLVSTLTRQAGVYSAAYGTMHHNAPLMSFERKVGHSPCYGLPSVALLP